MFKHPTVIFCILFALSLTNCAKRGTITGGLKDTLGPVLKESFPKNFSTNFKGGDIRLLFDENIRLKNQNKQLIISPPMQQEPLILPTSVSTFLTIKIKDSLRPNTTYSFNFGQSIVDNNEGNPYRQFKYVFSTGAYIDSLSISGKIKDAYLKNADPYVSVMLYEVNQKYTDSVVYTHAPQYITNTLDSTKSFKLDNLKAGKYLLVAMKDKNGNNKFNPKEDKIGFLKEFIDIPNDTVFEIKLFQETPDFKAYPPTQASGNRLLLGYAGAPNTAEKQPTIVVKNNSKILQTIVTQMPQKDSLQIWIPALQTDSLAVRVSKDNYSRDFTLKIKNQKKDTLNVTLSSGGLANFNDRLALQSSTPLVGFEDSKIQLLANDSVAVAFKREYVVLDQKIYFDFKKEPNKKYSLHLLPGALTDFYEKSNDSLRFSFATKKEAEYGNLRVTLQNVQHFPVLVELTNTKGDVMASKYSQNSPIIDFNLIEPAVYRLRIIYDQNKNQRYDSGTFLQKKYPEEVLYFSKEIDVRANWDVDQVFDVSMPYSADLNTK
ncbi:Ig-like domain-containing protein [Flavobacterium crassostreae]|uniref:SbsA Ig-like domain-containing protein n=1 Tax=Flavobacterium crassostreae TaxID=1763534 RepID=A0A1B9E5V6_9FLAO|nr:Ig-like domain-containing protein [Flavobacterium crassostreae]OCB77344.1 hypothetical protein LPBF_04965 [Flavobacterium crassostreae]